MTLMQLRCFVTLAEELNFTRVAERLYVSQTSISYQIKQLERELGIELFERTTKSVEITDAGKMIYRDMKLAIDLIDRAENQLKLSPSRPVFTVGYSYFCNGPRFRGVIERLSKMHLDTDILLENVEPEDDIHTKLLSKNIDAALFLDPFQMMYDDLRYYELGDNKTGVYVANGHRFASRQGGVSTDDIEGETVITFAKVEARHQAVGAAPDTCRKIIAKDIEAAMEMVAAGLGISVVPFACFTEPAGIRVLTSVPPPDAERMDSALVLVCRADDQSEIISDLAALLREVVERETPELCPWLN